MQQELRRGRHVVSKLIVHLVFVTKYRRRVISDHVWETLYGGLVSAAGKLDSIVREANHEGDHIHVMVEYPPTLAISTLVNSLKGVSSRAVRAVHLTELRESLFGEHFWSPSYFASSCGGAPLEVIQAYIQNQQQAALKGRVSTQKDKR